MARYPKVHGAAHKEYDRVHVVPLEVDDEKYLVDLDGQTADLWEKAWSMRKTKSWYPPQQLCKREGNLPRSVSATLFDPPSMRPGIHHNRCCLMSATPVPKHDLPFFNLLFYHHPAEILNFPMPPSWKIDKWLR